MKNKNKDKDKGKKKEEDYDENRVIVTFDDLFLIEECDVIYIFYSSSNWMIDSGTSLHVTFKRYIFYSYTLGEFGDVKLTHKL